MNNQFKLINNITGWVVFAIASIVYLLTIEPTTSFWDCGEFISSAYKLEVGHPPGAPFFMILGRFFTLFAGGDASRVAIMINALSALASSFTILFLFWTITHLARKLFIKNGEYSLGSTIAVVGAGVVGALAYTFSDTFWFSAAEGEVYATSSLFTAVVFWAILKWENVAHEKHADRWLLLIIFLMGLSIGVHLLNLLAIPAIAFVYYFKKYKPTLTGIIAATGVSLVILALVIWGLIPGLVAKAAKFELLFVNKLSFGFNSGVAIYIILLLVSIVAGVFFTQFGKGNKVLMGISVALMFFLSVSGHIVLSILIAITALILVIVLADKYRKLINTLVLSFAMIIIGYSSFAMIIIRSNANPPMDQNNPETLFNLLSYLNREQYGDRPLFKGYYYDEVPVGYKKMDGKTNETSPKKAIYVKDEEEGEYVVAEYKMEPKYDKKATQVVFPRMWASSKPQHKGDYEYWGRKSGWKGQAPKSQRSLKKSISFSENMQFFFRYQIGYMYMRYFMWNFAGRQNDIQGHGEPNKGNWISGIKFIDNARLGDQELLPMDLKNNPANNKYYFLPLIFGLLGMFYQFRKSKTDFTIVGLLFFLTGIAIVIYLNQDPHQPRERDYAYAGSFYAFAIWIGLGALMLVDLLRKKLPLTATASIITLLSTVLVPGIMAKENWDDHDRSGRYTARDFAFNYLESCDENAIIFTNGDNDTFPLWYAQEVEEKRTDVRVINLSYLTADWYIDQMKQKAYDSEPIPFTLESDFYRRGKNDAVRIDNWFKKPVNIDLAFDYLINKDGMKNKLLKSEKRNDMLNHFNAYGQRSKDALASPHFLSNTFQLPVDSLKVLENGILDEKYADKILKSITWTPGGNHLYKNKLMVLNLLSGFDWERPVYYAITVAPSNFINLENYFQQHGLAYKIVPMKAEKSDGHIGSIDTESMYDKMMNKFVWGGIDNPDVYLDENNRRMMSNMRSNFVRLARALIDEEQNDMAEDVLDRCNELISHENVPYSYHALRMAQAYSLIGNMEKAEEILKITSEYTLQVINYYHILPSSWLNKYTTDELNREIAISQELIRTTSSIYKGMQNIGSFAPDYIDMLDKSSDLLRNNPTIVKFVSMQNDQNALGEWYNNLPGDQKNLVSIYYNSTALRNQLSTLIQQDTEKSDTSGIRLQ